MLRVYAVLVQLHSSLKFNYSGHERRFKPSLWEVMILIDIIMTAIGYSSSIALAAAGITLIYMATGTFNFAHASMTAWGFYIVFAFHKVFFKGLGNPYMYFPMAMLFSGMLGVISYYFINRWLLKKGADMTTLMMSTLGIDLVFFAFINMFADFLTYNYKINARLIVLKMEDIILGKIAGFPLRAITLVSIIMVIAIVAILQYILNRTKFGIALRMTIENPSLAAILGINPDLIYLASWFIGGALAGLGGAILSLVYSGTPSIGNVVIVPEFAGSIVGGLYSIFGSLLGGYLIGMSEYIVISLIGTYVSRNLVVYEPLIPLIAMAVTLLVYPQGLGGIDWSKVWAKLRGKKEG